jgi:hypothetical protein
MMRAMITKGAIFAGVGAAAGAALGVGSAWLQSRSTSEQDRKNLGMDAPSLVRVDEVYEAVVQLRSIVAAIETANRGRSDYGASSHDPTAAQLYVVLVKELERICALEQVNGNAENYRPGMANKSLRYIQTIKSCLNALEPLVRRSVPTLINDFQELRETIENGSGDCFHNLSVQEAQYFENASGGVA